MNGLARFESEEATYSLALPAPLLVSALENANNVHFGRVTRNVVLQHAYR